MATEMNTDRYILSGEASCSALSCAISVETAGVDSDVKLRSRWLETTNITNETSMVLETKESYTNATTSFIELCMQRRLGLAMGGAVRRYRKISHAFNLQHDTSSGAELIIFPSFLIVTFDQTSYNTTELKRCEEKERSHIYDPCISLKQLKSKSHCSYFPYPTNRTGLIFNRAAIQRWMLQVSCSPLDVQPYDSESFESNFCIWMRDAFSQPSNQSKNEFDSVLIRALKLSKEDSIRALKLSKEDSITDVKHQDQAMSVSDIFISIHILCICYAAINMIMLFQVEMKRLVT